MASEKITTEQYRQIKELFNAALERDPGERSAFLDESCSGDRWLKDAVERLLAAREKAEEFIETPAIALAAESFLTSQTDSNLRIGPYLILREIGHGGMGTVYLAERADDEYRKQVAIKLVRRGLDTEDIIRRFRNERQILARLDHPHIARLLDGGTTQEGLPYFVMEYVEGLPLIDYCDRNRLSTVERLKLFRAVSSAVHFAHQNLVIHRDIKPGNILVTREATPKLLDFGIAKVLHADMSAEATITELRAMTPEYASPEQARGEMVTTASDIYSLGVLLYQLLTGRRPYRLRNTRVDEVIRAICDQEPEKPSSAVSRVEETREGDQKTVLTADEISFARHLTPEKLRRQLKGDLDKIVLMAINKEPQRRYSSVEQFSEDIRRHIEGLPCIARSDTFAYRSAKFIRRNRLAVAAAVLIALTLIAGIVATTWQARRAGEQSRIATEQRDRARREQAKAEHINSFLQQMLAYANPSWYAPGGGKSRDLTVIEALDSAARRIENEMNDQPEIKAEIHTTIGDTYRAMGRADLAEPHFEKALRLRRELFGEDHVKVAESLFYLGGVKSLGGDKASAERLFRQALAIQRARPNEGNNLPYMLLDFGDLLRWKGDIAEAERLFLEAKEIFEQRYGPEDVTMAIAREYLGVTYLDRGDVEKAESEFREALRIHQKNPSSQMAMTLSRLGGIERIKGNYDRAEALMLEALDLFKKTYGDAHFFSTGVSLSLAHLMCMKGDCARAKKEIERIWEIERRWRAEGRTEHAGSPMAIAGILMEAGEHARAESLLRERLKALPGETLGSLKEVAEVKGALGECLIKQRRFAEAEPLIKESLESIRACQAPQSPRIKEAEALLARLYDAWHKSPPSPQSR